MLHQRGQAFKHYVAKLFRCSFCDTGGPPTAENVTTAETEMPRDGGRERAVGPKAWRGGDGRGAKECIATEVRS